MKRTPYKICLKKCCQTRIPNFRD